MLMIQGSMLAALALILSTESAEGDAAALQKAAALQSASSIAALNMIDHIRDSHRQRNK